MAATQIVDAGYTFYAPTFEIEVEGQNLSQSVVRDVKEVTYHDSLEELDYFEFTLHDWDEFQQRPRYSSPYDENGSLVTLPDGTDVPVFDPGAQIILRMGYQDSDLVTMLKGTIVTVSPSFPTTGMPSLTMRALNPLYTLQKQQATMSFENKKDSEIAQEIGQEIGIDVEIPSGQAQNETPYEFMSFANQYPIVFLMGRARRLGYDLYINQPDDGSDPTLFFGRGETTSPSYELRWKRDLMEFTPQVKTRGQVTRVIVRGWRPGAQSDERRITGTATFADANLDLPDPKLLEAIDAALQEYEEEVINDPIDNQAEADAKALGILQKKLQDLITGRGTTVGVPEIRAGRLIAITGIGHRYSARYRVTESTHKINDNG
ncbi:MAG: phage late control D family protein, partial [Chloroflexi bacterium]|nr:phage late control D family protein [Chloroflexota bacterium]